MPQHAGGPGWTRGFLNFYVTLDLTTNNSVVVSAYVPGFRFVIEKVRSFVEIAGTGGGATRNMRLLKGTAVAASYTHTLAGTATLGTQMTWALSTTVDDYRWGDADTLSLDFASGGTAFSAGKVNVLIQYLQRQQQR